MKLPEDPMMLYSFINMNYVIFILHWMHFVKI